MDIPLVNKRSFFSTISGRSRFFRSSQVDQVLNRKIIYIIEKLTNCCLTLTLTNTETVTEPPDNLGAPTEYRFCRVGFIAAMSSVLSIVYAINKLML